MALPALPVENEEAWFAKRNAFDLAVKQAIDVDIPAWHASTRISGTGMPNGVQDAPIGALYADTAMTNGARLWVKTTAAGTKTGWIVTNGDTKQRDISTLIGTDWTVGAARIQRIDNIVTLGLQLRSETATGTLAILPTPPVGFMPSWLGSEVLANTAGTGKGQVLATSAYLNCYNTQTSSAWCYASLVYTTNDPWPTSLPGTAA